MIVENLKSNDTGCKAPTTMATPQNTTVRDKDSKLFRVVNSRNSNLQKLSGPVLSLFLVICVISLITISNVVKDILCDV